MGWAAIAIAFFGALIMSANQHLSKADAVTARFPALKPQGWWNHVPLFCFVIAGLVYGASFVAPNLDNSPTGKVGEATFREIIEIFDDRTHAEAQRIVATYAGQKATANGLIFDVRFDPDELRAMVALRTTFSDYAAYLWFDGEQANAASTLRKGERISAACTFEGDADYSSVSLSDCRLTGGPSPD